MALLAPHASFCTQVIHFLSQVMFHAKTQIFFFKTRISVVRSSFYGSPSKYPSLVFVYFIRPFSVFDLIVGVNAPNLRLGYEARRSGGLGNYLKHLGIFNVSLNLDKPTFLLHLKSNHRGWDRTRVPQQHNAFAAEPPRRAMFAS